MIDLLKKGRESKGLTTRQVASSLNIDQALISKFENGLRTPTKKQLLALAEIYSIDPDLLILPWLTQKILKEINDEPLALEALRSAVASLSGSQQLSPEVPEQFQKLLNEMESLKAMIGKNGYGPSS